VLLMNLPFVKTLKVGFCRPPWLLVSKALTHMESLNAWNAWMALGHSISSILVIPSWMNWVVPLSFHILHTQSLMTFALFVRRPLMVNRNAGQLISGGMILNVIFCEAHMVCWVRIW